MLDQGFLGTVDAARERWQVPALALAVSAAGRRESFALGCDVGTRFHVASITKPFTAALTAAVLDLDAPAGVWPDATVRQLLSHTAGRACEHGDLHRFGDGDGALAVLAAELAEVPRLVEPGRVWSYANSGYWLAGQLAAERAGMGYEEAILGRVCAPAGLVETDFGPPDVAGSGERYPRARRPSGGLVSTVADLVRFGEWQLDAGERMRVPLVRRPGGSYGLGWMLDLVGGLEVWHHGGDWGGFQSRLLLVPERRFVLAGLTNGAAGGQALRVAADEALERALGVRPVAPPTVPVARADLEPLAGRYAQADAEVEVRVLGDGLEVASEGESARARPIGGGEFEIRDGAATGSRFDFPVPGFGRFSSRLVEKVA